MTLMVRLGMHVAFGRVRRKTAPTVLERCQFIHGVCLLPRLEGTPCCCQFASNVHGQDVSGVHDCFDLFCG